MSKAANRNNVLAGSFLLGSIALAVFMAFKIGDFRSSLGPTTEYVIEFPLTVGVAGLETGSPINLAGQEVGEVKSIDTHYVEVDEGVRAPASVRVTATIADRVVLYEDAWADLVQPLLGSGATINISVVGSGPLGEQASNGSPILQPRDGEVLRGRLAPGLLAQAGIGPEQIEQVKNLIARADSISARIDNIAAAIETDAEPSTRSLRTILANAERFSGRFNGTDGWSGQIDSVLASAAESAQDFPPLVRNVNQRVNDVRGFVADARSLLENNRPRIDRTVANVEAVTESARFDVAPRVNELLDEGVLALGSYRELGDEVNLLMDRQGPQIAQTLANVRQMSKQGRLLLDELRAQPWRVLSQPDAEDLRREPMYNAARAYASAVSDLRAASEALEGIVRDYERSGRPASVDVAELARMTQAVDNAFSRYASAEQDLLDAIQQR